jgi:GNAT superfamily N-acetyltransferase
MLDIRIYSNPLLFQSEVCSALEHSDVMPNNMLLGLNAEKLQGEATRLLDPDYLAFGVFDHGKINGAAIQRRKGWLCFAQSEPSAIEQIIDSYLSTERSPKVIFGPQPTSTRATQKIERSLQKIHRNSQTNLAYELLEVSFPRRPVEGRMRWAVPDDLELLIDWQVKFSVECRLPSVNEPDFLEKVRSAVPAKISGVKIAIWEVDGLAVSMCQKTREANFGTSISCVYTPPEYRGKGYASHLVAHCSKKILEAGAPRCLLFTDAANPVSNGIYQRIGYNYRCEFIRYDFE